MFKIIVLFFIFISVSLADANKSMQQEVDGLKKPMFTPFVENYILNEIKTLRDENRELKTYVSEKVAQKEVALTSRVIDYSTATVTNMFYIIAAASSILVLLGWNSLRDVNERLKMAVDEKMHKMIDNNEERMLQIEEDLEKRSKMVLSNQEEIAKTNAIQSLWMRAGLEATPSGNMEIYNQILKIRPEDAEVISYKADAALEMNESNWAFSLAYQALDVEPDYPNAVFERARAYAILGFTENALEDLEKTCETNEQYLEEIQKCEEFEILKNEKRFNDLIEKFDVSTDDKSS